MTIKRIAGIGAFLILVTLAFAGAGAADITSSWSGDTLIFTGNSDDTLNSSDITLALQKEGTQSPYTVVISGIGNIGIYAFKDCNGLTSVTIGNSVTNINQYAFKNCYYLKNISFENSSSVTTIGNGAFAECIELEGITIPSSVTNIGELVFENCWSLSSITVDSGNTLYKDVDGVLFKKEEKEKEGEETVTEYTLLCYPAGNTAKEYTIPDTISDIKVTTIGGNAFHSSSNLTSIVLGDNVQSIKGAAFNSCSGLTSITFGASVKEIEYQVFTGCTNITDIYVDSGNTTYSSRYGNLLCNSAGNILVYYPAGRTAVSYTIPEGVTEIGSNAFEECQKLETIVIPSYVITIDNGAFYSCKTLLDFDVEDGGNYKDINGVLFNKDGTSLICYPAGRTAVSYTIPEEVTMIGHYSFSCSEKLESIVIKDSVTTIGEWAFAWCTKLSSITIPDGVISIGAYAFYHCSELTSITIPDGVTSIDKSTFEYCYKLEFIIMPNVTSIGDYAFESCSSLSTLDILPAVNTIGNAAFANCSALKKITFRRCDINIGNWAFEGSNNLNFIYCLSGTPTGTYMDKFGDKRLRVWYLAENPGITTYDNEDRYVVVLNGGVLKDNYQQNEYSLPEKSDMENGDLPFIGWYDDNEYTIEHTGDIVAGTTVYALWNFTYTFTIPSTVNLNTIEGGLSGIYTIDVSVNVPWKSKTISITLNTDAVVDHEGTSPSYTLFSIKRTVDDTSYYGYYQVGKYVSEVFTPLKGKNSGTSENVVYSWDMSTDKPDHVDITFKTVELPPYTGVYTGSLNFMIGIE